MLTAIINSVVDLINESDTGLDCQVGQVPEGGGLAAYMASGSVDTVFLDKGMEQTASITINCECEEAAEAVSLLGKVHLYLNQLFEYPRGDGWQIYSIVSSTAPNFVSMTDGKLYFYGSIIAVKYYVEGVTL